MNLHIEKPKKEVKEKLKNWEEDACTVRQESRKWGNLGENLESTKRGGNVESTSNTPKAMSWTKQKGESGWRLRFVKIIGYYNKVLNFQNKACGASHTHALLFFVFQSIK